MIMRSSNKWMKTVNNVNIHKKRKMVLQCDLDWEMGWSVVLQNSNFHKGKEGYFTIIIQNLIQHLITSFGWGKNKTLKKSEWIKEKSIENFEHSIIKFVVFTLNYINHQIYFDTHCMCGKTQVFSLKMKHTEKADQNKIDREG